MELDLTPEIVLHGYELGVFPMADRDGELYWYSPDPRSIFEYERFRVPRSLRPIIRQEKFEIRVDKAFDQVIHACADRAEGTWISPELIAVYSELHRLGHAHSVESWQDGKLTGGLYGMAIGGAFFGESMFHRVADASKVALVALVQRLKERGFALIDTQWSTPHLERFGVIEIPRKEYLRRLSRALALSCQF
jgi:leucyl/phenylalanyl-tRNA--protein transferase